MISSSYNSSDKYPTDLIYGTSINIHNPRKIGLVRAFLYIKDFPLIIIGPDCKYNII